MPEMKDFYSMDLEEILLVLGAEDCSYEDHSSPNEKSDLSVSSHSSSHGSSSAKSSEKSTKSRAATTTKSQSKFKRPSTRKAAAGPLVKASTLALDAPFKYTKYLAHMFNHNDVSKVITMFQMIASESIQVTFNVYGEIDPQSGQPKNRFGRFCTLPFASREHFYRYCQVFHRAAPDAVLTVVGWSGGKTPSGKCYVMGEITYEATMLDCRPVIACEDPACVANTTTTATDPVLSITNSSSSIVSVSKAESVVPYNDTGPIFALAKGTVMLTFDEQGKVDAILFRYCYDDHTTISRISQRMDYYDKNNY